MTGTLMQQLVSHLDSACRHSGSEEQCSVLLSRFVREEDQGAFEQVLLRHGPLVYGTCRRILQQEQDAEDAFQATFLVLAHRARSLIDHPCLRAWLYETASRTAMKLRVGHSRRRRRERSAHENRSPTTNDALPEWELREILDEELHRLPEHYRLPLWLCYWEGRGQREAARELGWAEGELRGRLHRGRARLRRRLIKRGLGSITLLPLVSGNSRASATVTSTLIRATADIASRRQRGEDLRALVSPTVSYLTFGGSTMMLKAWIILIAGLALSVYWMLDLRRDSVPAPARPAKNATEPTPTPEEKKEDWQDVLKLVDPDKHTVGKGIWRRRKDTIVGYPAHGGARLRIPVVPRGAYELRVRWEPEHQDSGAVFVLPHGGQNATAEFLGRLSCAGLGDLNGVRPDINETKKPLKLKPGKVYEMRALISWGEKQIHVRAKLDDETYIDWEGKRSEVHHEYYASPKPYSLGLALEGQVSTFHSIELRMLSGEAEAWKASPKSSTGR